LKTNGAKRALLWGTGAQYALHEKIFAQKVTQKYFGQVWGNSGKNPSHPQIYACSYTHMTLYALI